MSLSEHKFSPDVGSLTIFLKLELDYNKICTTKPLLFSTFYEYFLFKKGLFLS